MRVLYVTAGFPFPLTSGYLRHYFLIRELAERGHEISLLSLAPATYEPAHAEALAKYTERVLVFPSLGRSRSVIRKGVNRLRQLAGSHDRSISCLAEAARQLCSDSHFDVVLFSGKKTVPVLASLDGLPLVADLCDATSARLRLTIPHARPGRRALLRLELAETTRAERAIVERASSVVFASRRDLEVFVADHGSLPVPASVIPNGVDLEFWRRSTDELGDAVVFTGAMDYAPNEDAALQLVETILPLVHAQLPDTRLLLVGRDPTRRLRDAGAAAGVTVTGYVDDVRPYLEQAAVFAAPLRFGAGIQNKILEAMAMEVPVVATPLAAAGLYAADGHEPPIGQAELPDGFANCLVSALLAARSSSTPDRVARRFVGEAFSWPSSGARLETLLLEAATRGRRASVVVR